MGNTFAPTPLARLISWWARREDRMIADDTEPDRVQKCGSCGILVPPGAGFWNPRLRAKACTVDCADNIEGYNY